MKKALLLLFIPLSGMMAQSVTLIPANASWKYLANGTNQGTSWRSTSFNDGSWSTGNAELGYGDGDEATVVSFGPSATNKYITTYFRKSFSVTNPAAYTALALSLLRDDGAVVYLNGTQVARSNMPSGTITYTTRASSTIGGTGETTFYNYSPSVSLLIAGTNVIAVEIHQSSPSSPDISFNLQLTATPASTCGTPGGLNATSVTAASATLNWTAVSGALSYNIRYRISGASTWMNTTSVTNSVALSGLTAATTYQYSIQAVCASGSGSFSANATFTTQAAPACGVPAQLAASAITSSTATLSWGAVSGAVQYNIRYRAVGAATWIPAFSTVTTTTIGSLTAGTKYEFAVQAACGSGSSTYSTAAIFTTLINGNDSLITTYATWKYLDNGTNQGTAWRDPAFNDASWLSGGAELGYGDGDEVTVVSYGTNSSNKYITTYFRKAFSVSDPALYSTLTMSVVRDDGIVVYLNGTEVYRNNMPTGTISYTTLSPTAIAGTDESAWNTATIPLSGLNTGNNVIAVEIHQQAVTSSDISFRMRLWATGTPVAQVPVLTRQPYLQKLSPSSVTIRWRTDIATDSRVDYGTSTSYGTTSINSASTTEHTVTLSGLTAATRYFYKIGSSAYTLQGDGKNNFITAPTTGTTSAVRIWVTGDFGNGSTAQGAVRDAFVSYTGATAVNLWLWLGDNAYNSGTDAEFQSYVFNMYPDQLKSIPLFPSPGNHDYGNAGYQTSSTLGTGYPYFSIFTVPQLGESGGVASNTPKYYSFNYANIHFISLDSYGALNTPGSAMYNWLSSDLAANTQRWTVVYFHHPPYTLGTHNSDTNQELINMRTNIVPLLETYHVDLVLSGHSHVNERSYLIKGHFGTSGTFTNAMKVSTATNTFTKTAPYNGTVYAVCGTSGQLPGSVQAGYPMPCMYFNNNSNNCSLVIDVNGDNLACKYLTSTGNIADQFTIAKSGLRTVPGNTDIPVTVTSNYANRTLTAKIYVTQETPVHISLASAHGDTRDLKLPDAEILEPGLHQLDLELPTLSAGIYLVKVTLKDKIYTSKILIP